MSSIVGFAKYCGLFTNSRLCTSISYTWISGVTYGFFLVATSTTTFSVISFIFCGSISRRTLANTD